MVSFFFFFICNISYKLHLLCGCCWKTLIYYNYIYIVLFYIYIKTKTKTYNIIICDYINKIQYKENICTYFTYNYAIILIYE